MNELDILELIARDLAKVKHRAALSHLPSHRMWVRRLHEKLSSCSNSTRQLNAKIDSSLADTWNLTTEVQGSAVLQQFCKIVPCLLEQESTVLMKLLQDVELVPAMKRGEGSPERKFAHFSQLVTAVRQFVDTTIQIAFQLCLLDAREFNFHVLNSLHSFVQLAPNSLQVPFMTDELVNVIEAFDKLKWSDRKNSPFCGTNYERFGSKVDVLNERLQPQFFKEIDSATKALFRFSSEFAHIGYTSTLITSADPAGIYLGSEDDCFLRVPRTSSSYSSFF